MNWTLDDVRLPANDVKHALRLYAVLNSKVNRNKVITYDFSEPPPRVRGVVEYEKFRQPNFLHWQFRKVGETILR